jgi:MFS family permease
MIFLPDMVVSRFGYTVEEAGGAVGFLVASFSFGNFLSSFYIGHLSDSYGRKPMMLIGLVGCAVLIAVFGAWHVMHCLCQCCNAVTQTQRAHWQFWQMHHWRCTLQRITTITTAAILLLLLFSKTNTPSTTSSFWFT